MVKAKATDEEKALVKEADEKLESVSLEEQAGLVNIETNATSQVRTIVSISNEDKELVVAALNVLAEVIERKITDTSTKRYLSLLLVFIKSALG